MYRKLKVSCRGRRWTGRGRPTGRKKDLSLTPCHTTHTHIHCTGDSYFFISYRSEWNRSSWSAEIFATRVGIIYRVIISPENWIVGLRRAGGNVHIRKHVQMARWCARRETNRLFVDRRMTNCFGITFSRELCSRILSSHPLLHPFPPNKRESNSSPEAISSPYISICIRLKRFICHRGELQSTSIRTFYTFDLPRLIRELRGHHRFVDAKFNVRW